MAALGDLVYRGSSLWKRLPGQITASRKVLCQTGTGSVSAAPTWDFELVQRATVTLTDAQIKALPTFAAVLIPAPGPGFRIQPIQCSVMVDTTAGAYTNMDADAQVHIHTADWNIDFFDYLVNGNATGKNEVFDFLGNAARTRWYPQRAIYPGASKFTPAEWGALAMMEDANAADDQPLILALDNGGSGDLTGGNAANTMRVTVYYAVEAI